MPFQIVGGQLVDAHTGQVMSPEELENELYLSQMSSGQMGGSVGNMQIVGQMTDGSMVYQAQSGQIVVAPAARGAAAYTPPGSGLANRFGAAMRGSASRFVPFVSPGPTGLSPASFGSQLKGEAPGPIDLSPLSIDSQVAIGAGLVLLIPTVLQTIFRPERLSIGASVAPFFTITQLSMGNVPLTANVGEFAAETFADDAVGANIRKVTGQPGQTLFVGVRNEDVNARRFRSTFFGASSQPEGCRT